MTQHGKKYLDAAKLVDRTKSYEPAEAVDLVKQTSVVNFDPTVEAHIRLGVDPRHADQMVRGTVVLPHGTGKVVRVAVFAQAEKAQEALRAGADEVGGEDLVKKIEGGWLEFDVAVATPDMMGMVGKLGRILGRRGLMPNPKAGTVTFDVERAVGEVKGGRVEFKVDKGAIIHVPVGKASFSGEALVANLATLLDAVNRAKPVGRQGHLPPERDDRQHDGTRGPRGPAVAPRRRERLTGRSATIPQRGPPIGAPHQIEDGPPQTACARGPRRRSPRGPAPRPGLNSPDRTEARAGGPGDAGGHAEAGPRATALPGEDPRGPCETRGMHRLAGTPPDGSTGRAGSARQERSACRPTRSARSSPSSARISPGAPR